MCLLMYLLYELVSYAILSGQAWIFTTVSVVSDPSFTESPYWIVFEMLGIQKCVFIVAYINESWHCYWSSALELREWYKSCKPDRSNWTTGLILLVKLSHRCSMGDWTCKLFWGFISQGLFRISILVIFLSHTFGYLGCYIVL